MNRALTIWLGLILTASVLLLGQTVVGGKSVVGGVSVVGQAPPPPGATFINSGKCATSSGSCTVGSLSIPTGSVIVVGMSVAGGNPTGSVSDSNSDTPSCTAVFTESASNQNTIQLCVMKAGATVTSFTCTSTFSNGMDCPGAWYSPGSLTVALDKSTGQDQPNTTAWTSGNTATLTASNELVVGFWGTAINTITSTYSDGGTQRVSGGTNTGFGVEDRNVSSTAAVASSGSFSVAGTYGVVLVMAIK